MSRQRRERRKRAEERWPLLSNMFARYFNSDFGVLYGSLQGAIDAASRDGPIEHRRAVLKELSDWNITEGTIHDVRPFLHDGFAIDIAFSEPIQGRNFMNRVYDDMIAHVRAEAR